MIWLRELDSNQRTLWQELMRLPRMTTSQPRIITQVFDDFYIQAAQIYPFQFCRPLFADKLH